MSPAQLVYGQDLKLPVDVLLKHVDRCQQLKPLLRSSSSLFSEFASSSAWLRLGKRFRLIGTAGTSSMQYAVGDQVLLSGKNLPLAGTNKFCSQFVGPFAVVALVGPVAVWLVLTRKLWGLHPVFHVSFFH